MVSFILWKKVYCTAAQENLTWKNVNKFLSLREHIYFLRRGLDYSSRKVYFNTRQSATDDYNFRQNHQNYSSVDDHTRL